MSAKTKVKAVLQDMPIGCTAIMPPGMETRPFWVLKADAESYDAMVEQMAKEICYYTSLSWDIEHHCEKSRNSARAALAAIGITPPRRNDAAARKASK